MTGSESGESENDDLKYANNIHGYRKELES